LPTWWPPPRREEPEDLLLVPVLLATLPQAEREVVLLRFFGELHQDEIAVRVGWSQMHVSRLLRRAIARMRAQLLLPS
jgi:RNA polymerase sigma-B factor